MMHLMWRCLLVYARVGMVLLRWGRRSPVACRAERRLRHGVLSGMLLAGSSVRGELRNDDICVSWVPLLATQTRLFGRRVLVNKCLLVGITVCFVQVSCCFHS